MSEPTLADPARVAVPGFGDELIATLGTFVDIPDDEDAQGFLDDHPEIRTPELVAAIVDDARSEPDEATAARFRDRAAQLCGRDWPDGPELVRDLVVGLAAVGLVAPERAERERLLDVAARVSAPAVAEVVPAGLLAGLLTTAALVMLAASDTGDLRWVDRRDLAQRFDGLLGDLVVNLALSGEVERAVEAVEDGRVWLPAPAPAASATGTTGTTTPVPVVWVAGSRFETVVISTTDHRTYRLDTVGLGRHSVFGAVTANLNLMRTGLGATREEQQRNLAARYDPDELLMLDKPRLRFQQQFDAATVLDHPTAEDVLGHLDHDVDIAHLHCHGHYDVLDPFESRLELATGLTVRALLDHPEAPWLVNLCACWTAICDIKASEQQISLPTAYLRAGAAHVLATLWTALSADSTVVNTITPSAPCATSPSTPTARSSTPLLGHLHPLRHPDPLIAGRHPRPLFARRPDLQRRIDTARAVLPAACRAEGAWVVTRRDPHCELCVQRDRAGGVPG